MSTPTPITPELRAKILSALKDEGLSVADAAKNYGFTEDTIRRWLRGSTDGGGNSSSEVQRLRKELQQYKDIVCNLLLERELAKKNIPRSQDRA